MKAVFWFYEKEKPEVLIVYVGVLCYFKLKSMVCGWLISIGSLLPWVLLLLFVKQGLSTYTLKSFMSVSLKSGSSVYLEIFSDHFCIISVPIELQSYRCQQTPSSLANIVYGTTYKQFYDLCKWTCQEMGFPLLS